VQPPLEQIPMFVKSGTILPLAEPTLHTEDPASWRIDVQVYGDRPTPAVLYEDDGSWNPAVGEVTLTADGGRPGPVTRSNEGAGPKYQIRNWKFVG